jgi:CRAL/TRIO domain
MPELSPTMSIAGDKAPNPEILPLCTAVVRLKSYGKGEENVHKCRNTRPHLFVLTPDAIQVFTTADAEGPIEDSAPKSVMLKAKDRTVSMLHPTQGPLAGLSLKNVLGHRRSPSTGDDMITGGASSFEYLEENNSLRNVQSGYGEDPEDLSEGQVFRLGVALSQIVGVEIQKDVRIKVYYQPNRPSKKGSVEEQTLMVLRGLLRTVDIMKFRDYKYGTSSTTTTSTATTAGGGGITTPGGGSPRATATITTSPIMPIHKNAHHFTIVTESREEAAGIKEDIEHAQRQLAMAVFWLSEGLPLRGSSNIMMVTVSGSNTLTSASASSNGSGAGNGGGGGSGGGTATTTTTSAPAAGNYGYTIPYPAWDTEIDMPMEVSGALANPTSRKSLTTVIRVYLSTPLGPATAEVPVLSLMQSAAEGSAPVTTRATLQDPTDPGTTLRPGKKWHVLLQWKAIKGDLVLPPIHSGNGGGGGLDRSGGGYHGSSTQLNGGGGGNNTPTSGGANTRALATPSGTAGGSGGSMAVLVGLAALSGATAVARRLRNQWARIRGGDGSPGALTSLPGAPQQSYRWKLVLIELSIETEEERSAQALPAVKRSLSVSVAPFSGLPSGTGLPHHIELLAQQYPKIITPDIARRFIIGLGSETKAFSGLSAMAQWMTENRLTDILRRPQPAFKVMKKHYPHGFPGWSRKKDCLVELECMGQWPRAYDLIAADGVSEQAMLEHLLFTYQYAFAKIDARPLPDGKTVKIVDLNGLCMSDLRSAGFKLITRVGAMLSMNYPQRLHRCFLINAPGWWAVAWKIISPIVPAKIRAQMSLFSKSDKEQALKSMLEWIDEDVIPAAYGGKNELPLSECSLEITLAKYVAKLNSELTIAEEEDEEEEWLEGASDEHDDDDDDDGAISPSTSQGE